MPARGARSRSPRRSSVGTEERSQALALLKTNPQAFENFDEALREDREIVLAAVKEKGRMLQYAGAAMKADVPVVLAAVRNERCALEFASEDLKNNRTDWEYIALVAVRLNAYALSMVGAPLNTSRKIVLAAVEENPWVLDLAVRQLGLQLDPQNADDRAIILAAVRKIPQAVQNVNIPMTDPQMVLAAVQENGMALRIADAALQADFDIVLAAVTQNGLALEFAAAHLLSNPEIVVPAVQNEFCEVVMWHIQNGNDSLQHDRDLLLKLIEAGGAGILRYADGSLQADKSFMLAAVCTPPRYYGEFALNCALEFAAESIRNDREIVLPGLLVDPSQLEYAGSTLKEEILVGAGLLELLACTDGYFRSDEFTEEPRRKVQAYVNAILHPMVIQVTHAKRLSEFAIQVTLVTLGGTTEVLKVMDNTTAALRMPLASKLDRHPACFNFVLLSGGQMGKNNDDVPLV